MRPTEMNAKGYFESNRMMRLNNAVLEAAGAYWFTMPRVAPEWFASLEAEALTAQAVQAIEADFGESRLFVLKDPRMCRLLPLWRPALRQAGRQPLYVCTHRHPIEVARSLTRWYNYEESYCVLLWLRHVLDAEAQTRGAARVFTSYDRLMQDWRSVATGIECGFGLNWPRALEASAPEIEAFLAAELRHFKVAGETTPTALEPTGWAARVHAIMEVWAASGERTSDHAVLDDIRDAFDRATPSIMPLAQASLRLRAERAQIMARLESVQANLTKATQAAAQAQTAAQDLAEARATLARQQRERDQLDGAARAAADRIAEVERLEEATRLREAELHARIEAGERERADLAQRCLDMQEREIETIARARKQEVEALSLRALASEAEERAAGAQRQATTLLAEAHVGKTRLAEQERRAATLETALGELRRRGERDALEIAGLGLKLSEARGAQEESRRRADTFRAEMEAAQADLALRLHDSEAQRQKMAASFSWRITSPLRKLAKLARSSSGAA